ncbi:hypothetical protein [Nocardia sp. NPDC005825]|uniref:hypothetical protein n=1 Tax=unclassified Nocardia TaxID=2637762 RepID=UPI0033F5CC4D
MTIVLYGWSATHTVTNQASPLAPYDAAEDLALLKGLRREGGEWAEADVRRIGLLAGGTEAQLWADDANRYTPPASECG